MLQITNLHATVALAAVALTALAVPMLHVPSNAQQTQSCELPAADRVWVNQAVQAWRHTRRNLVQIPAIPRTSAIFFSQNCMISSSDALFAEGAPSWTSQRITEYVPLPEDNGNPIAVVSRAQTIGNQTIFVMAAPSIWRAANVPGGGSFSLETLMTAVMIHEAAHVSHGQSYLAQFPILAGRFNLPESWNDDSIQDRFRTNTVFATSVARETDLLFAAASATNDADAYRLARQARNLMQGRRARFYRGADQGLGQIEDLFLTLEGAGQWVGYTWLTDQAGGNVPASAAMPQFARRANFWSQTQGLAITMATHRLDRGAWQATVFGDGSLAGLALLDRALTRHRQNRQRH
jgi:hypothetical protein